MSESNNHKVSLYKINFEKINFKIRKDNAEDNAKRNEVTDSESSIEYLVTSKKPPYDDFNPLKLKEFDNDTGYNIQVYYNYISSPAKWIKFFEPIVDDSENKFFQDKNAHKSFAAFVYLKNELYAFCGGLGSHLVKDYVDDDFGISVLTRLIEKDDVEIKRAINRSLTGSELSSDRFFKANYKIVNEDSFGKIFKSIYTSIPKEILWERLKIPKRDKDRAASVVARSYFELGRAISYKELLSIISNISGILKKAPFFELNKIKAISNRALGGKELIDSLIGKLSIEVFRDFENESLNKYDLFHKDMDNFIKASEFELRKGNKKFPAIQGVSIFNLESIFQIIAGENFFIDETSKVDLKNLKDQQQKDKASIVLQNILDSYKIVSKDADGNELTSGSVFEHIQAEVEHEGQSYFFLEDQWYFAQDGFLEDVNADCKTLISQIKVDDLLVEKWNLEKDDENSYVEKYLEDLYDEQIYPLHKVLYNKMELCDLLVKKDRALYFVHIKRGFDGSVRDLISQVYLSAKVFIDSKSKFKWEDNEVLSGYYDALKALDGDEPYLKKFRKKYKNYKKQTFINIFKDKVDYFHFVFAIVDEAKNERSLPEDIKKFKSAIAKMSLINLERDVGSIANRTGSLKFIQIKR